MGLAGADLGAGLVIGEVKTEIGDVGKSVVIIGRPSKLAQKSNLGTMVRGGKMKLSRWVSEAIIVAITVSSGAQSQSLLYKPAVQPKSAPQQSPNCNMTIPFAEFVGKKIVFLAQTAQFQRFGYQSWHFQGVSYPSPSYQDLAGKIGTIISIDMSKGDDAMFKDVVVRMDDSGKFVTTKALNNSISDVVFLDDIEYAKSHFVGKTLWIKTRSVRTTQDVETYDGTRIRKYSAVRIVDAVPGTFQYNPIDLVIETDNHRNVLAPTSVSLTNVSPDMVVTFNKSGRSCGIDESFSTTNPRLAHNWPESIWQNIEQGRVVVGMNLEQVILAKGEPDEFNETKTRNTYSAQLVYDNSIFIYINSQNIVTAIQK